ncbi:NAD(P)/FAD-dependent oxidoreductase [Pseudorhizobium halotolerans]|nr:NAD(P)/FAD-dependent oxidoreductase [Pseudorhizobium halotolerans]
MVRKFDAVILGAGAAGMMCAIRAGQRGRRVLLLDHAKAPGEKIRISGGGRCNFTNTGTSAANYISANPHFAKSALARYTPRDFIALVDKHGIAWHEKTLGQLFCNGSAKEIIGMLTTEMRAANVEMELQQEISSVEHTGAVFRVGTSTGPVESPALVVATGGKSIPKMGATGLAYRIAEQFGLNLIETRPGLVPLTLDPPLLERLAPLSGVSVPAEVRHGKTAFREALLITHRGMSGPAILQISSYWREGDEILLKIEPEHDLFQMLRSARRENGRQAPLTVLSELLPRRLAQYLLERPGVAAHVQLADCPDRVLQAVAASAQEWRVRPAGSEGYRTAEVTLGGVDTKELDSRTLAARKVPGLHFIGECVDVTGWLGGYNFQWAWASGHVCGDAL